MEYTYLKSEHQFIASLKVNSLSNTLTAVGVRKGARELRMNKESSELSYEPNQHI